MNEYQQAVNAIYQIKVKKYEGFEIDNELNDMLLGEAIAEALIERTSWERVKAHG